MLLARLQPQGEERHVGRVQGKQRKSAVCWALWPDFGAVLEIVLDRSHWKLTTASRDPVPESSQLLLHGHLFAEATLVLVSRHNRGVWRVLKGASSLFSQSSYSGGDRYQWDGGKKRGLRYFRRRGGK